MQSSSLRPRKNGLGEWHEQHMLPGQAKLNRSESYRIKTPARWENTLTGLCLIHEETRRYSYNLILWHSKAQYSSIALQKCWTQAPVKTLDLLNDARNNASCSQLVTTRYNSPANLHYLHLSALLLKTVFSQCISKFERKQHCRIPDGNWQKQMSRIIMNHQHPFQGVTIWQN